MTSKSLIAQLQKIRNNNLNFLRFLLASLYAGGKVSSKRAKKSNGQSIDESRLGSNKTVSLTES